MIGGDLEVIMIVLLLRGGLQLAWMIDGFQDRS